MIEYTSDDLQKCIFNTNHASNYLSLKGQLGRDKNNFLKYLKHALKTQTCVDLTIFVGYKKFSFLYFSFSKESCPTTFK